jgi:hypothetical protein
VDARCVTSPPQRFLEPVRESQMALNVSASTHPITVEHFGEKTPLRRRHCGHQ